MWPCRCSVWWKTRSSSSLRPPRWEQPECDFQTTAVYVNLRRRINSSAVKFWQFSNVENNWVIDHRGGLGPKVERLLPRYKVTSLPCWVMTQPAAGAWPVRCLSSQDCLDSTTPVWERRRAWRCCISSAEWCIKSCQETQSHSGYQSNVSPRIQRRNSVLFHYSIQLLQCRINYLTSVSVLVLCSTQDWCRHIGAPPLTKTMESSLNCLTEDASTCFRCHRDWNPHYSEFGNLLFVFILI